MFNVINSNLNKALGREKNPKLINIGPISILEARVFTFFASCTWHPFSCQNDIRIKDFGRLINKSTRMVLFPLGVNNIK